MTNTLYDAVFGVNETSTNPFLITHSQSVSFATFNERVNQIAHTLVKTGVKPGDRVAVQAAKSVTALALYAATLKAGAVYLPLNTGYTPHELEYFITNADAYLVIIDERVRDEITPIAQTQNAVVMTLNADETGTLSLDADKQAVHFTAIPRRPDDLAAILYTSGTTGRSKGAKLSHQNLLSNAIVLRDFWHFTSKDVLLHMLPIYHSHGLFVACNLLAMVGGAMIFLPRFDIRDALDFLPQASCMMGVPTFYTRLLADDKFTADSTQHIRLFISGSAPLLAETHQQFEARTGQKILERYGMTETNMNISNPYHGERRAGTVGVPLPGVDIRIMDPKTGERVTIGDIGILELKGENVFSGYWRMPEKTAEAFHKDGYFITGDMAKIDEHGYVEIVGRDKDLIISGGLNIYPSEIEREINAYDGVVESAVIGAPHEDFGEAALAIIVAKNKSLSAQPLLNFLSSRLAKFKQPKALYFVDELPRNSMGKVQKAALRKTYKDTFSSKPGRA